MSEQHRDKRAITSPANGRRSHGPVTEEGKAIVSQNARRHGILAQELVIAALGELEEERLALEADLRADLAPVGIIEELLVERILVTYWRLRRVLIAEAGMLTQRVAATAERLVALRSLIATRDSTVFAPADPDATQALSEAESAAFAAAFILSAADADRIHRYETALTRVLNDAIAQLTDLQERRVKLQLNAERSDQ